MPTHITVGELQAMHTKKKKGRRESFEYILEKCHTRMRTCAAHNALNCFFEVPTMVIGLPLYNVGECTDYIVQSLRRSGFLVQLMPTAPGMIYISWDSAELNPRKSIGYMPPTRRIAPPSTSTTGLPPPQSSRVPPQPPPSHVNWFRLA